ncbi:MAG: hypothetical protein ACRDNT_30615 [Streptosporangiaceae bacterium]
MPARARVNAPDAGGSWAINSGFCRLGREQAGAAANAAGGLPRGATSALAAHPGGFAFRQLFSGRMKRRGSAPAPAGPRPDHAGPLPLPPAGRPASRGRQLTLFQVRRDLTRPGGAGGAGPGSPWLAWGLHVAGRLGESRGWTYRVRSAVRHGLTIALSSFAEGDVIRHPEISAPLRQRFTGAGRVAEVLTEMGIYTDDRRPALEDWLERKLAALPPGIRRDVTAWARALRDGTARSGARSPRTVSHYVASALPAVTAWSARYDQLRQVTRDDIPGIAGPQRGRQRNDTTQALRSLFRFAIKTRSVFRNPVTGLTTRGNHDKVIQPLTQAGIDAAVAAVTTPAGRLVLGLAAIHAARNKAIREIVLADIDLGNRRLTIAGHGRPLDDLTRRLLLTWQAERRRRWPATANPHLIINKQTAMEKGPVSGVWINRELRGQAATLERLRADRQLHEARATGADPLHLAAVFGIHETTAMCYALSARQLLETAAERQDPAGSPRTQGPDPPVQHERP